MEKLNNRTTEKKIFSGVIYGKTVEETSFTQLKRIASSIANEKFETVDKMQVSICENGQNVLIVHLFRFNKRYPDNKIIRGKWE